MVATPSSGLQFMRRWNIHVSVEHQHFSGFASTALFEVLSDLFVSFSACVHSDLRVAIVNDQMVYASKGDQDELVN
jgi:hypothetical protein